jgi:glycosyltransferase involved in cell wall biosynthesis
MAHGVSVLAAEEALTPNPSPGQNFLEKKFWPGEGNQEGRQRADSCALAFLLPSLLVGEGLGMRGLFGLYHGVKMSSR